MKKIISLALMVVLLITFFSCANKGFLREGVISYQTYFADYDSMTELPLFNTSENRIWFSDSSVIYEIKIIGIKTDHTSKGTFEKTSFDFFKYTYLDLRTMRCQDYFNLKDTAFPVNNYLLEIGHFAGWEFFTPKYPIDTSGIMSLLPDTIIDHKNYSRIKIKNNPDTLEFDYEFYLDCKTKNNMFHLNPTLDEMYPRCKVVRSIMKFKNYHFTTVFNTKIVADTLSKEEKTVFAKWAQNAIVTKLPLINYMEANKLTMQYRNY